MRLDITPEHPALDTELSIRVSELPPASRVTLHAHSTDAAGQVLGRRPTLAVAASRAQTATLMSHEAPAATLGNECLEYVNRCINGAVDTGTITDISYAVAA
jgi:hypothetical protein